MTTQEFEKQTLEKLLNELKDIDNYKSFRKGAFVYDLGHYQGQLLLEEINRLKDKVEQLQDRINETIEYIENNSLYEKEYDYDYEENIYLSGIDDTQARNDLLDILKCRGE